MVAISQYFARVGIQVDNKSLKDVDKLLASIERKLNTEGKRGTFLITPKINVAAFQKHLRQVLRQVGGDKTNPLRIRVQVSEAGIKKSLTSIFSSKAFAVPVTPTVSQRSLAVIRRQVQQALAGANINVRLGGISQRTTAQRAPRNPAAPSGYSWSPNPSGKAGTAPHLTEWLAGRPDRSSLSAANRRFGDKIMSDGMTGALPKGGVTGLLAESVFGGIGRVGSSSIIGRGLASGGMALMGAKGGPIGLMIGAALGGITSWFKMSWTMFTGILTAPFKILGSVIGTVTNSFYRLAMTLAPLIGAFALIDNKVIKTQQSGIALNTISKAVGSTGETERKWLMNMANRDGLRFDTLMQPFTSFIASASPAVGLPMAKNIFEAMTQFGVTRGADDESMKRAMVAVSQMAGKGKVGA